jgi:predicted ATP-grasp superfamily ATP-dependent carboligase
MIGDSVIRRLAAVRPAQKIGSFMTDFPHAVVVGGKVNGLGVARSLAVGRVSTIIVDTTLRHAAMWSRSCRRMIVSQLSGRKFIDALFVLQRKLGGRPVLILTDEMAVHTVSKYREEIKALYRFQLPSPNMVETLGNKSRFHDFAQLHNFPVPKAVTLQQEVDLAKLSGLRYPVIAKPADKSSVFTGHTRRVDYIGTVHDAEVVCRRMLNTAGEVVVQEWIDGPDSNIYFCLFHCGNEHKSADIFYGRKVLSHPPRVGNTAICVAAPEVAAVLQPLTEKFLDVAEYRGLGSLEFKWDAATQRFLIIEPTVGRTDWQEEIATLSGVNLPLIAYRYELGLPALPQRPVDRAVAWRESFRHLKRWPASPAGGQVYDGYWRIDDPVPALIFYADSLWRVAFRRLASTSEGNQHSRMERESRSQTLQDGSQGPFKQESPL